MLGKARTGLYSLFRARPIVDQLAQRRLTLKSAAEKLSEWFRRVEEAAEQHEVLEALVR